MGIYGSTLLSGHATEKNPTDIVIVEKFFSHATSVQESINKNLVAKTIMQHSGVNKFNGCALWSVFLKVSDSL